MSYSVLANILTIVPNLPQADGELGYTQTSAVIAHHQVRASGIINSMLSRRYSVPFSPAPELIMQIEEDIVIYYCYRSFYTADNYNKVDSFEELKDDGFELLKQIMAGDIDLVDTSGSSMPENAEEDDLILDSNTKDYKSFFDIDDSLSWSFIQDQLDNISNER